MLSAATLGKRSRDSLEIDEQTTDNDKHTQQDSVYHSIKQRSLNNKRSFGRTVHVSAKLILPLFKSPNNLVYQFLFPDNEFCTPFYCDFSHRAHDGQLLAIGDEEGRVSILRTDKDNDMNNLDYHHSFYCQKHAITDVKWSMNDDMMVTASHDRVVRLWDTESKKRLAEFAGHGDIVKSVYWHPTNEHLIVTGSKDGSYRIWDTRFNQLPDPNPIDTDRIPIYNAIKTVSNAHDFQKKPSKPSNKKSGFQPLLIRSVTCAMFLNRDEEKIISSGSADGCIKLWDIRAGRTAKAIQTTLFENKSGKRHGITDLKISGNRLFSSCMDNSIYMHYLTDLSRPAKRYTDPEYKVGGFDVKIDVSPDDQFLLSGSHDKNVFVWEVSSDTLGNKAVYQYEGHTKKVTGVAWSKRNLGEFATCSDDFTARIWKME